MKIKQYRMAGSVFLWEGHRFRLRRRMEREGWDALKPHEMVELVLCHAVPRQNLSDVARLLVDRFGTVGGVFAATREQLMAVGGMTGMLTGELMRAYHDLHEEGGIRLFNYRHMQAFLASRLACQDCSGLWALYVDFDFNLITYTEFDPSETWWDADNARRMLEEAVGSGARYVFLVLWTAERPAALDDMEAACLEALASTLRAADLDLVDCVVANGDGEMYSMNRNHRMEAIRAESGCGELHERY